MSEIKIPQAQSLADMLMSATSAPPLTEIPTKSVSRQTQDNYAKNGHKPCSRCHTEPRRINKRGVAISTMCTACDAAYRKKWRK